VHDRAHKTQIRQAVEQLFDVHVVAVRTASVGSKPKRRGHTSGRTREWKKAIVQVKAGETIPVFSGLQGTE
jgi:large subunit ribosomal protein L23